MSSESIRRLSFRVLIAGLVAMLLAASLWLGFEIGRRHTSLGVPTDQALMQAERDALLAERDALRDSVARASLEQVIVERERRIDRERTRALTEQLKEAQDAHLAMNRELSYLKRLVREGGQGALRARDLRLLTTGDPDRYRYSFSVVQVIPGVGAASGRALLEIEGRDHRGTAVLRLEDLPEAKPRVLDVALEHLQTLSGSFRLPPGFEPSGIRVRVESTDRPWLDTTEAFPWVPLAENETRQEPGRAPVP